MVYVWLKDKQHGEKGQFLVTKQKKKNQTKPIEVSYKVSIANLVTRQEH